MNEAEETKAYERADYYDASDSPEQLSHATPEEAIEYCLDGEMSPGCDAEAVIREYGEITIVAYERKTVDPGTAKQWAERFADQMNEWWPEEEYGNPDDDSDGPGTKLFIEQVTPVIQMALDRTEVWQCEDVAKRTYSVDEVLAMMREECPDWFGETTGEREIKRLRAALEAAEMMLGFPAEEPGAFGDASIRATVAAAHKLLASTLGRAATGEGSRD